MPDGIVGEAGSTVFFYQYFMPDGILSHQKKTDYF